MGNTLQTQVDKALKNVLEGGSSKANVNPFGNTTYTAAEKNLCHRRVGEGLYLSGKVNNIKVSTPTAATGLQVCFGGTPQLSATIQGVHICISSDVPADVYNRAENAEGSTRQQRDETLADLQKHLANLRVHVSDVVLELKLDGHHIVARIASANMEPQNRGRYAAKWEVEHCDVRLELDGKLLVNLRNDKMNVDIAQALRRIDIDLKTELNAKLDVEQLLVILNVAAAVEAVLVTTESSHQSQCIDSVSGLPCEVKFLNTSLKLDMNGDPLFEARSRKGSVSVNPSAHKTEILLETVNVTPGTAATVLSDVVSICAERTQHRQSRQVSFTHNFLVEEHALPWRGALEVLLDDPRFARHKAWLESVRDNKGIDIVQSNKRRRDEGNSEIKKSRL